MGIVLFHLTDIHLKETTDLGKKQLALCNVIVKELRMSKTAYFIISGDIAFSGKANEYGIARKFLSTVKQLVNSTLKTNINFKVLLVPGNHDCDFEKHHSQVRKLLISNLNYSTAGEDNSVYETCLRVQNDFWEFYKNYQQLPADKLYYIISERNDDVTIHFHCINTAWASKKEEKTGELFFPVKNYLQKNGKLPGIHIGIWHHPYNWFSTSTPENNKKEFEKFTEEIAQVHFFGHEHEQSIYFNENKGTGNKLHLLSGQIFHEDKQPDLSGFQTVTIDSTTLSGLVRQYSYNGSEYLEERGWDIDFKKKEAHSFDLKKNFLDSLEEVKIPLIIDVKRSLRLSEIFVYPDLDPIGKEISLFENYLDSSKLLENNDKFYMLEGENQIGKSCLLNMLFKRFYEQGFTPVKISGKEIKDNKLDKIVKNSFRQQYNISENDYSRFEQLPIEKKVLLVDDYNDSKLNSETTSNILREAMSKFGKGIFVISSDEMFMPSIRARFSEISCYKILPLGYKKRNELIEKFLLLKQNKYTLNDNSFLEQVKVAFDNVQAILGDKLMPSYPIFILSILQAFEYKPLNQNETSSAYCYQTLIHYSLYKAGVANEDLDTFFNFLTELAYKFILDGKEVLTKSELNDFYIKYSQSYVSPQYDSIYKTIKKATIITEEDDCIRFRYNYILYYLSAKKIADILNSDEGKRIVKILFEGMHLERNANILVFITHHSKNIDFIEESLMNSMLVLENVPPITIEKKDPFYNALEDFALLIKNDILETNRNPRNEREKMLLSKDKREAELINSEKENDDVHNSEITIPFQRSFRSIEIVGQIVKNRKGSLPKTQLLDMLSELYTTGFRTIGYITNLIEQAKVEVVNMISEEVKDKSDADEIEKKINRFMQLLCYESCKGVFVKLMHSAGNKDLRELYLEVANRIGTPAAKLVSFGINSYYNTIRPEEVKSLADEFSGNHVALRLLRGRVRAYVYYRNPDFRIKQKFASYLNMSLAPVSANQQKR